MDGAYPKRRSQKNTPCAVERLTAQGQKQTFRSVAAMSALPPKADIG